MQNLCRKALLLGVSLLLLFSAAGCSYVPTRSMAYDPIDVPVAAGTPTGGKVVVRVLEDERPPRAYPGMFGSLFLTYIPFVPYIRIPYERLDASDELTQRRHSRPYNEEEGFQNLIMRTVADDLRSSGLFEDVLFIGANEETPACDYVLEGKLSSTEFDVYATSYMLGFVGVALWFLPIPMGANAANVEADLRLLNASGDVVWTDMLKGRRSKWFSMYTSGGASISSQYSLEITKYGSNDEGIDEKSLWAYHASAIRSGMESVKQSLATALAEVGALDEN